MGYTPKEIKSKDCAVCGRIYTVKQLKTKGTICPQCYRERRLLTQKLGAKIAKAQALKNSNPQQAEKLMREAKELQVQASKFF